jgi:ring-1,2-phenylacetyl-CoA epoxidase subunit PaaD
MVTAGARSSGGWPSGGGPPAPGAPGRVRAAAYDVAAATPDPELPMVTIGDLGILRDVAVSADGIAVTITPTYSGCPAMREIGADIIARLAAAGFGRATVKTRLAPPWSTDWISDGGKRKLAAAGIAPPPAAPRREGPVPLTLGRRPAAACPRCGSAATTLTAAFSATACKALYRCDDCGEPFEAVKPL